MNELMQMLFNAHFRLFELAYSVGFDKVINIILPNLPKIPN